MHRAEAGAEDAGEPEKGDHHMKKPYFPMYIDLSESRVLIVGSGTDAKRRARFLSGYTNDLAVIAAQADPEWQAMETEGKIRLLVKPYEREDLYGADMVIAADTAEVNDDIYAACKCLGIRVHTCGNSAKSDFYFSEPETAVRIYTDGSARGNPEGPGGYAAVLEFEDRKGNLHTKEISGGYAKTTNNRMELMAAISGLEALGRPCSVRLFSDSKYLVDAFNQHWVDQWIKNGWKNASKEPVKNRSLWERLLAAKEPHQVAFEWVRGHNGHPQNERCDELAVKAALSENLPDDDL